MCYNKINVCYHLNFKVLINDINYVSVNGTDGRPQLMSDW